MCWLIDGDVLTHCKDMLAHWWRCVGSLVEILGSLVEMCWFICGDVLTHCLEMWWLIVGDMLAHCLEMWWLI